MESSLSDNFFFQKPVRTMEENWNPFTDGTSESFRFLLKPSDSCTADKRIPLQPLSDNQRVKRKKFADWVRTNF